MREWASREDRARRAFRRLPCESESPPPGVMRLKRHHWLRSALAERAKRAPGRIDNDMDGAAPPRRFCATRGDLQQLFGDAMLLERVARVARLARRDVSDTLDRARIRVSPLHTPMTARTLARSPWRTSTARPNPNSAATARRRSSLEDDAADNAAESRTSFACAGVEVVVFTAALFAFRAVLSMARTR